MFIWEKAVGGRRRALALIVAAFACVSTFAVAPAIASAVSVEVDSTGDQADETPGSGGCKTAVNTCTLRAAIQETNASVNPDPETPDIITFNENVFEGQLADTIVLGSVLPAITEKVRIEGRQCTTEAGAFGPCQGTSGPDASNAALTIEGTDQVEIEGLAITGARTGINVIDGSKEVRIKSSWLGVKLDGGAGGNTAGIFIDPESNGNVIGSLEPGAGNVFANNSSEGLAILGADNTIVRGNYFGVKPDGVTHAANGKDIEVTSQLAGGFVASGNLIGVQAESEAAETEQCDRGCNVIAGATASGVDLQGNSSQSESPAVETHVAGNFIGLGADGTTVVPNAAGGAEGAAGIKVGAAAKTLIGGPEKDESEANFIAGGTFGIYQENANALRVLNNEIGFNPAGAAVASPVIGMYIFCLSTTEAAAIEGNAIGMDSGGVAIEQRFLGAEIIGNFIEGGQTGILSVITGGTGNLIEENEIEGTAGNGILLTSDGNEVLGNEVFGAGAAGIRVQDTGSPFFLGTTENRIGGDTAQSENAILSSGGDAIEIVDLEETANEVGRNSGFGNGGLFIDLVATEPGKDPNGGIEPPAFSTSTQSTASGSGAKEGAVIRVFRKGNAEAGELESFLAETQADPSGNWKVVYPGQIPTGTIVAATQTSKGATSELSTATSTKDPVKPKDHPPTACPAAGPVKCPVTPQPPVPTPQTRITMGPKAKSDSTTAKFKFSSSVKGSSFQCKLDKGKFKKCKSPKKYTGLKPGKHVFKVRAVNSAGKADPTPAKRKFQILP